MVQLLLSRGFDPNTINQDGNTPLHLAMISSAMVSADLLLNFGVDELIKNNMGKTPWDFSGD